MKSKAKKLNGTAWQIDIVMSKEKVDETFDAVLKDVQQNAVLPGFRQGKAPVDLVRKNHNEDIFDEVKRRLIPEAYQKAIEEHGVDPLSYPEVSEVNVEPTGVLSFTAIIDAHPEIKLKKYKGLKVTSQKISVTDDEVDEVITRLRNMHAEFTDTDTPLEKNEFGICDVETFIDGESIAKKRENMWVEVDKEASLLGMGAELCGLKKGDSKDIDVTLPEGYPDKKFAGKKAVFKVLIKETKKKSLPEVNDELAKKLGKETISEAKEELKSQLLERKESDGKVSMKNQIMEQLLANHSFDLPESMIKRQFKVLMDRTESDLVAKGIDADTIESHKAELNEQLLKEAQDKVKSYFILDAIGNCEKIGVTNEEVDGWITALAESYKQPFEKVREYYEEHDLVGGLKEQLREEKTLDHVLEEAEVTQQK